MVRILCMFLGAIGFLLGFTIVTPIMANEQDNKHIIIEKDNGEPVVLEKIPETYDDLKKEIESEEKIPTISGYALGPGDQIRVTVFGESELSNEYTIDDTGMIAVPLLGSIKVSGLDARATEIIITEKLKEGFLKDPSVTVQVLKHRPFYILGEVRRPGSYNYINGLNILKAVALSGGFTYRANRNQVEILRGNKVPQHPEEVPVSAEILPGDIILIKERFF